MPIRLRRSVLYVPGSNGRAIEKARSLDADAIVLDLEDAVTPEEKARARAEVAAAVRQKAFGLREVVVRLNHPSTEWHRDDLSAMMEAGPSAILLPKVEAGAEVLSVAAELKCAPAAGDIRVWIMVETPAALGNIMALAGTAADPASRLDAFVLGTNDLVRETRIRLGPDRRPLQAWLSSAVLAARCHGLDIIDGVFNTLDDADGFRAECEQGRDFGFDGKTLIHPSQIAPCNAVFSPGLEELRAAKAIVQAFEDPANAGRGAIRVDGKMVERLHAEMAIRTLAVSSAIALRKQTQPS